MTGLLWFMAPWPPIDRSIKCFSNITISQLIDCQIELTATCDARVLRRGRRSKTKLAALAPLRQSTFWILLRLLLIMRIFTKKNFVGNKIESGFVGFIFWEQQFLIRAKPPHCFHSLCLEDYADFITGLEIQIQFVCKSGDSEEEPSRAVVFEETNDWMINRLPGRGAPDAADAPQWALGSRISLISAALCVFKGNVCNHRGLAEPWQTMRSRLLPKDDNLLHVTTSLPERLVFCFLIIKHNSKQESDS